MFLSSFVGLAQGETTMSALFTVVISSFHIVPYMKYVFNKCCYNLKNNKVQFEKF